MVFCKIDHCIHIHWWIVMGLAHNDPWVESHMWPQQTWGQRSSRGQWPLVQIFGKKGQCIHILCIFKSNITKYVIAKAGETCGSRTALFGWVTLSSTAHERTNLVTLVSYKQNGAAVHGSGHRSPKSLMINLLWLQELQIKRIWILTSNKVALWDMRKWYIWDRKNAMKYSLELICLNAKPTNWND